MASRDRYLDELRAVAANEGFELKKRRRWSFVDTAVAFLALVIVFVACVWVSKNTDLLGSAQTLVSGQPAAPTMRPTLTSVERFQAQQDAPSTASEQQVLATPAPVAPAGELAPGYVVLDVPQEQQAINNIQGPAPTLAPVPTPESVLTQEQLQASEASDEAGYLRSLESTLTGAQKAVQVYEAENNAEVQP